ncbi:MAG: CRTAC1 family protein [Candidatus Marinimicrobia bacterium]|nr:CRTAC1 family protein [Candidatus Neomarinimicrobiota bacterium]
MSTMALAIMLGCGKDPSKTDVAVPGYASAAPAIDSQQSAIVFTDITREAGLDFVHISGAFGRKWMPETLGSGGGFLDYDNDGLPDIFLVNSAYWTGHESGSAPPVSRLYRNLGAGRFEDVSAAAGLDFTLYGMGCTFADYDNDGDLDIYITAVGDNKLLRNDSGIFTDVTRAAGVLGNSDVPGDAPAWSTSAAWLDYDRDGWLDLFVCNYVKWTPETDLFTTLDGTSKSYATPQLYQGETSRLYRNLQGKRFVEVTQQAGVYNPEGKSLGVAVADFNHDHWPDIIVANDTQPNFLYLNNGDGTFSDVALPAGVAYDEYGRARGGMGIDVADLRNDGNLSIAIGNFAREPLSLYTQIRNDGLLFQDLAGSARITQPTVLPLTFGLLFADLDLDGYQDLVVGNGHIEPHINDIQQEIYYAQKPQLFRNTTRGRFVDLGKSAGPAFDEPMVARGIASADIDNDGDIDLLITTNGGTPKLLRNDLPQGPHWIKIRLVGAALNVDAIGAAVTVWSGDLRQTRWVRTGSSYLSQSDISTLIFGLGEHSLVDSVTVQWPISGNIDKLKEVKSGQTLVIHE